jgi:hypothetical protein
MFDINDNLDPNPDTDGKQTRNPVPSKATSKGKGIVLEQPKIPSNGLPAPKGHNTPFAPPNARKFSDAGFHTNHRPNEKSLDAIVPDGQWVHASAPLSQIVEGPKASDYPDDMATIWGAETGVPNDERA